MRTNSFPTYFFLLSALIFLTINASAEPEAVPKTEIPPDIFDIATDSNFSGFRLPLIDFLKTQHAHKINTVCLLGEQYRDRTRSAWVIWQEGRKLILWDGVNESLSAARRILDMDHDVVADTADINGSTYLVTHAWVQEQQKSCDKFGTKVKIKKSELKSVKE